MHSPNYRHALAIAGAVCALSFGIAACGGSDNGGGGGGGGG